MSYLQNIILKNKNISNVVIPINVYKKNKKVNSIFLFDNIRKIEKKQNRKYYIYGLIFLVFSYYLFSI
jgi:hypothetical protein